MIKAGFLLFFGGTVACLAIMFIVIFTAAITGEVLSPHGPFGVVGAVGLAAQVVGLVVSFWAVMSKDWRD